MKNDAKGNCFLCGEPADLRQSHIIPNFVLKWLKHSKNALLPSLLTKESPGKAVQQSKRFKMLGECCENRFSRWEKLFERKLFTPYVDKGQQLDAKVIFEDWFEKLSISFSWRLAQQFQIENMAPNYPPHVAMQLANAALDWKKYLLEKAPLKGSKPEWYFFQIEAKDAAEQAKFIETLNLPAWYFSYQQRVCDMGMCSPTGKEIVLFFKLPYMFMWHSVGAVPSEKVDLEMIEMFCRQRAAGMEAYINKNTTPKAREERTASILKRLTEKERLAFFKTASGMSLASAKMAEEKLKQRKDKPSGD